MPALPSAFILSSLSNVVSQLTWFGVATGVTANWTENTQETEGIGIGSSERKWTKRPAILDISIETILGEIPDNFLLDNQLNAGFTEKFNLEQYLANKLLPEGIFRPADNTAALSNITLQFTAGQVATGSFVNSILRPDNDLQEWFSLYQSASDIPTGTGDEFVALPTEAMGVRFGVSNDPVLDINTIAISVPISFAPVETKNRRIGFIPKMPVGINVTLTSYVDKFVTIQDNYREVNLLADMSVANFTLVKPKIINVTQANRAEGYRQWTINLQAKNLIKDAEA